MSNDTTVEPRYDTNSILSKEALESLYVGREFKSYKVLCKELGLEYPNGKRMKNSQEKELNRIIKMRKDGWKIIIEEIYPTFLPKQAHGNQGKVKPNTLYRSSIECILMQYLSNETDSNNDQNVTFFSYKELYKMLGMINYKYTTMSDEELKDIGYNITNYEINHFFNRSDRKLYSVLTDSLNSLQNRSLINYSKTYRIVHCTTTKDGEECFYKTAADDHEITFINSIKRDVLDTIAERYGNGEKIETYSQVMRIGKTKEYNKLIYEYLKDGIHGKHIIDMYGIDTGDWEYFYACIKIIFDKKQIVKAIPANEIKIQKLILNNNIADFLRRDTSNIDRKRNELSDKIVNYEIYGGEEPTKQEYRNYARDQRFNPYNYLDNQVALIEELIRI